MTRKKWKILSFILTLALISTYSYSLMPTGSAEPSASPSPSAAASPSATPAASPSPAASPAAAAGSTTPTAAKNELPQEANFKQVGQSSTHTLFADPTTGHFKVEDKRNGNVWRSYPDPDQWAKETIQGTWRNHLRSPIMIEFIDLSNRKSKPKTSNIFDEKGAIKDYKAIDGGFQMTLDFPGIEFSFPIEVKLKDDYVETKIVDAGLIEGKMTLLNAKLYPFLGAAQTVGQEGYMVVPDGSGALIHFKENRLNDNSTYREPIFGKDAAFNTVDSSRVTARMPIFGIKSADKAMLVVARDGMEYSTIFASPSGAFSQYNWISSENSYRLPFTQITSKTKGTGFITYPKDRMHSDRVLRYYFLDKNQSDYSGMAAKYREYLMKEQGLKPLQVKSNEIPVRLDIIGADTEKGLLWDRYLTGTTTSQAKQMLEKLNGLGIKNIAVNYQGWQDGGKSAYGSFLPVDKKLGGNSGMKSFVDFAHSINVPVYLTVNYSMNNVGGSFNKKYDGIRNMAGTVLSFHDGYSNKNITMVSPQVVKKNLDKDLEDYKKLKIDGLEFRNLGNYLNSDYNTRYPADRQASRDIQQQVLADTSKALGYAGVVGGNFYTLPFASHVNNLSDDYSYDLFVDEPIPFAQTALHGLVSYTSAYGNVRDQYKIELLRGIEYGSQPAFLMMNAPADTMKRSFNTWEYSLNFDDWQTSIKEEYEKYNKALGDVQNQFIVSNKTLAKQVKETTYANGKRIIVNYNPNAVTVDGRTIPAQDFVVVNGGASK